MWSIALLLLAGSLINTLLFGINAHNIILLVLTALFSVSMTKPVRNIFSEKIKGGKSILSFIIPIGLLVVIILTGIIFNPYAEEKTFAAKYNKSVSLLARSDYDDTMKILDELEQLNANDDQVLLAQGILYLRLSNISESWNYLNRALRENPYDINILFNMGLNRYHNKNLNESRSIFESIVEKNPTIVKAHVYAGTVSMEMGDYKRAIYHLENAVFIDPQVSSILYYLGVSHMELMEYAKAGEYFKKALEQEPSDQLKAKIDRVLLELQSYPGGGVNE